MRQVIIALVPATVAALVLFKERAIFLIAICVISAVATENVICRIRKRPQTTCDYSAALTGLLLALTLSPGAKWYAALLGGIVAIAVGKHLFGGLGANIFNPALVGRAFIVAAYPDTIYLNPFTLDAVTGATPLALRKFSHVITPIENLFLGNIPGTLGETSALCLLIGGCYLLMRRAAGWRIPVSLLLATIGISFVFYFIDPANGSVLFHLFGGGLLIGAFFMATDPVTTPVTKKGRYIFGIGCAVMIMVLRYFSGLPEGVMFAILFFNALTPLINRYTRPKRFGT